MIQAATEAQEIAAIALQVRQSLWRSRSSDPLDHHGACLRISSHRQERVNHEHRRDGGTGLIGSKTDAILRQGGHEVIAASPQSGINTITGEGLKEALAARKW